MGWTLGGEACSDTVKEVAAKTLVLRVRAATSKGRSEI